MKTRIITVLLATMLATPLAAQNQLQDNKVGEIRCGKVLQRDGASNRRFSVDSDLHVLQQSGAFDPGAIPAGAKLSSIFCFRTDIVPAPGDYRVVSAGYPLMIYARDSERLRIAVLETAGGRLQYRAVGTTRFDPAMRARIQAVLDEAAPKTGPRPVVR